MNEIKFPPPPPLPGYACPRCGGRGNNGDGSISVNYEGTTVIRHPTTCALCLGSGRVNITPIKKEDLP